MPAPKALGTRRRCLACSAAFYDLGRTPIHCVKCGEEFTVVEYARRPEPLRKYGAPFPKPVAAAVDEVPALVDDADETLEADEEAEETLADEDEAEVEEV